MEPDAHRARRRQWRTLLPAVRPFLSARRHRAYGFVAVHVVVLLAPHDVLVKDADPEADDPDRVPATDRTVPDELV